MPDYCLLLIVAQGNNYLSFGKKWQRKSRLWFTASIVIAISVQTLVAIAARPPVDVDR
jgi:hypothetical protein